jgi:hypothetical protein
VISPTLPTAPARAQELRRRGFAHVESLLPADLVVDVAERVRDVLAGHGWVERDGARSWTSTRRVRDGSPGWWEMYEDVQRLEALHRLAHHPDLVAAVEAVVGGRVLNHPRRVVRVVQPAFWVPPYQEFLPVQGTPDVITAVVPLHDDPSSLRLLREDGARHLRPVHELPATGGVTAQAPGLDDPAWAAPVVRPGDVTLVHGMTVQACVENTTDELRVAALFRLQRRTEPVCKASLKPHHYSRLPDWPSMTEGWSDRRWVRVPRVRRNARFVLPTAIDQWAASVDVPDSTLMPPRRR